MARIRRCKNPDGPWSDEIFIICFESGGILRWDYHEEKWKCAHTSKTANRGRYHKAYNAGEKSTPLQFMVETGHTVPDELEVRVG